MSQRICKGIEEPFGRIKTVAGQAITTFAGVTRLGFALTFAAAANNLVRLPSFWRLRHEQMEGSSAGRPLVFRRGYYS